MTQIESNSFDVFLSHNSDDKSIIRKLVKELEFRAIRVWFDENELRPGSTWQDELENIIGSCSSAVVTVGASGLGPWQDREMKMCIQEFVRRKLPVIPVLLPTAPSVEPKLPKSLQDFMWVDLRQGLTVNGLDKLQWGITGRKVQEVGTKSVVDDAIRLIRKLSLSQFRAFVVEPLLKRHGVASVASVPGNSVGEKMTATKLEFGKKWRYSILISEFNNDAIASPCNVPSLLDNIASDLLLMSKNRGKTPSNSDRFLVFTSQTIDCNTIERLLMIPMRLGSQDVIVIDPRRIVAEIDEATLADIVAKIGDIELQYKLRIAGQLNTIAESSAFGLSEPLKLDSIYVSMSVSHGIQAMDIALRSTAPTKSTLLFVEKRVQQSLAQVSKAWHLTDTIAWCPPREISGNKSRLKSVLNSRHAEVRELENTIKRLHREQERTQLRMDFEISKTEFALEQLKNEHLSEFDVRPLLSLIKVRIDAYLQSLTELAKGQASRDQAAHITAIVKEGIAILVELRSIFRDDAIRKIWPSLFSVLDGEPLVSPKLSTEILHNVLVPIHVTGGPGAGKTTLVRRLAQQVARSASDVIPIVVYAIKVREVTEIGLIRECVAQLCSQGRQIEERELETLLMKGRCRLFVDGLDEAGAKAEDLFKVVKDFAKRFEKCNVVATSRDSFRLKEWEEALTIHLAPLDDQQLLAFLKNWFTSNPTKLNRLIGWLSKNKKMNSAARTPIMAAVLCTLFDLNAEMPSTEIELYGHRFDLLLGKWDQAKGIPAMPANYRARYLHFLMQLAFQMHCGEDRTVPFEAAEKVACEYFVEKFHGTPFSLVMDCIRRGLLEQEAAGGLSFGHLTYQEYLVGKWLAQQNDIPFTWARLHENWWLKSIDFYAAMRQEIDGLVKWCTTKKVTSSTEFERVCHLAEKIAPLTSKTLIVKFKASRRRQ